MATQSVRDAETDGPFRQCALTRERLPVGKLLRFCLDPDGRVVPDLKRRLPGRGVWVTATREAVAEAARKGVFPRAFAQAVTVDPALPDTIEALLERAALERLSLANKAGLVVAGFAKVSEALQGTEGLLLLHAGDAADGGKEKIDAKAGSGRGNRVECFNSGQLSLALGRSNVVHAAMRNGGARESFLRAVESLQRFRGLDVADEAA